MTAQVARPRVSRRRSGAKEDDSGGLRSMEFALLGFGLAWDMSPLPSFLFLPFGMRMSILYVLHHCIMDEDKLFSRFQDEQMEKNFALS